MQRPDILRKRYPAFVFSKGCQPKIFSQIEAITETRRRQFGYIINIPSFMRQVANAQGDSKAAVVSRFVKNLITATTTFQLCSALFAVHCSFVIFLPATKVGFKISTTHFTYDIIIDAGTVIFAIFLLVSVFHCFFLSLRI